MKYLKVSLALFSMILIIGWVGGKTPVNAATLNTSFYELWKEQKSESYNKNLVSKIKTTKTSNQLNFKNPYLGIEGKVSSKWEYNFNYGYNYMRFFNSKFRVDVFNDQIDQSKNITKEYIYNHTLNPLKEYTKLSENIIKINGYKVRKIEYLRPRYKNVKTDLNFYTYYFIENSDSIKTLQLKTSSSEKATYKKEVEKLISNLKFYSASPLKESDFKNNSKAYNSTVKLSTGKGNINITKGKIIAGAYTTSTKEFSQLSADSGKSLTIRAFYKSISSSFDTSVKQFLNVGQIPMAAMLFEKAGSKESSVMADTIQGGNDKNITSWAKGVKASKGTVMFRIGNEMNGNWSKWGPGYYYNDPDLYQMAFKRIYTIFKNNGVTNAKFIYNPNSKSSPNLSWNDTIMYYPGAKKTDFIGLTAYNYGSPANSPYTFSNVYKPIYYEMTAKFTSKPFLICEIGAVEDNVAPKPQFITDSFSKPQSLFPSVKGVVWFDQDHPPYGLKLSSSSQSYKAFKNIKNIKSIVRQK